MTTNCTQSIGPDAEDRLFDLIEPRLQAVFGEDDTSVENRCEALQDALDFLELKMERLRLEKELSCLQREEQLAHARTLKMALSMNDIRSLLVGKNLDEAATALQEYAKANPEWRDVYLSTTRNKDLRDDRLKVDLDDNGRITHVSGLG